MYRIAVTTRSISRTVITICRVHRTLLQYFTNQQYRGGGPIARDIILRGRGTGNQRRDWMLDLHLF